MPATQFQYDCPHCLTRSAGFKAVYHWPERDLNRTVNAVAICGVCNGGLLFLSTDTASSDHPSLTGHALSYPGSRFLILKSWPEYHGKAPDHAPANVAHFYEQGLENLVNRRWDAAGAMFRKTLDVATKNLRSDLSSKRHYDRIEAMVDAGDLTPAMGQWSHQIRMDGNDAIHSDEPETEGDARATQRFAEAFLTYAYTLPELVRAGQEPLVGAQD